MPTGRNSLLYVLGEWSAIPSDERVLWLSAGLAGLAMICMYVHMAPIFHMTEAIPAYCINGAPVVLSVTWVMDNVTCH